MIRKELFKNAEDRHTYMAHFEQERLHPEHN